MALEEAVPLEDFRAQRNSVEASIVHPEQQRPFSSVADPCHQNLSVEPLLDTDNPS